MILLTWEQLMLLSFLCKIDPFRLKNINLTLLNASLSAAQLNKYYKIRLLLKKIVGLPLKIIFDFKINSEDMDIIKLNVQIIFYDRNSAGKNSLSLQYILFALIE